MILKEAPLKLMAVIIQALFRIHMLITLMVNINKDHKLFKNINRLKCILTHNNYSNIKYAWEVKTVYKDNHKLNNINQIITFLDYRIKIENNKGYLIWKIVKNFLGIHQNPIKWWKNNYFIHGKIRFIIKHSIVTILIPIIEIWIIRVTWAILPMMKARK